MPVVVNGHARTLGIVRKQRAERRGEWAACKFQFDVYGPSNICAVTDQIETIRDHFGVNKTTAMRLALKLTADAVRAGRLRL